MNTHYKLPSVQLITNDLKREVQEIISTTVTWKNGDGSYKTFTYNTIQFVMVYWMTPTGLKVRFRVFKEIVDTVDQVVEIINVYWINQSKKGKK